MPIERRTRVEIFLPVRSDLSSYQAVLEWFAEEFAFTRGGSTLTVPFTGLFLSSSRIDVVEDAIRILTCDFELDSDKDDELAEILEYLEWQKSF